MPGKHINLSKSGYVNEEDQSDCKSQNITIRTLKGSFLCQILIRFEWAY